MEKKKVFIGLGLLAVGTIGYFAFKNKKRKDDVANAESLVIDDSDISESDINYLSSNGTNPISIKKYLNYIKTTPSAVQHNKNLINRKVYSLFDNLNIRNEQTLENISKVGIVPKKHTYLGRISELQEDMEGDLWFVILAPDSNYKIKKSFNWGKGINPYRRYVKATAVFADLNN